LVATNFLGINTPAILATEALYLEMWAQDALAMYTYAAASGAAAMLTPLTPATPTTNPGGGVAQAAAVGAAASVSPGTQSIVDMISSLPAAIGALGSPITDALDTVGLGGIITDIDTLLTEPFTANIINSAINTAAWWVMATIPTAIFLANTLAGSTPVVAEEIAGGAGIAAGAAAGLAGDVEPLAAGGVGAAVGEASLVGSLSVPAGWAGAAPLAADAGTALAGSGWTVSADAAAPGMMAGVPGMAAAAKGAGAYAGPRYGFKPIVMPKSVVV
jgi:PPE-repeat protein